MELYFINSMGEERKIQDVNDEKEALKVINTFCKERNFKIYYIRNWEIEGGVKYDVGSHTEFFIVRKK